MKARPYAIVVTHLGKMIGIFSILFQLDGVTSRKFVLAFNARATEPVAKHMVFVFEKAKGSAKYCLIY